MIDERSIEEAAEKQIETIQPYSVEERLDRKEPISLYEKKDVLAMFKAGINWFLDNLWHDASEVPKMYKGLLVEYQDKSVILLTYSRGTWSYVVNRKIKKRWLYIEDLLKGWK